MTTVRDITYELLRSNGLMTFFGNPGSNELPFLAGMPEDFHYILGLHEGVVTAMADGYAQASGRATFVSLHAAAGTGNAMGALSNAASSHSPLVVMAGQQVRAHIGLQALLTNIDATQLPKPLVKYSAEPALAADVPRTLSQAIHYATLDPQGPAYISVPYDDWEQEVSTEDEHLSARTVTTAKSLPEDELKKLARRLSDATNPVLVLGSDVDSAGANQSAVLLAEKLRMPTWIAPSAARCSFPNRHSCFRGLLPASISGIARLFRDHDLVLVVGAPVFRYHQYEPGRFLEVGTSLVHITVDPDEASRAPVGNSYVAGILETLDALAELATVSDRSMPQRSQVEQMALGDEYPLHPATVFRVVDSETPDDVIYVKESTSTVRPFWEHVQMSEQGSYYFPSAGGLGFGMAAAVGVQLARPERQVVGIIGDGSANYAISALWTAARYQVPVIFIILNNGSYAALRSFAKLLDSETAPGLDIPGIDFCAIADGYGVDSVSVTSTSGLAEGIRRGLASDRPLLIEVRTAPVNPFELMPQPEHAEQPGVSNPHS